MMKPRSRMSPWVRAGVGGLVACLLMGGVGRTAEAQEAHWWDNYPIMVLGHLWVTPSVVSDYHGDVSFNGSASSPSWGTYGLLVSNDIDTYIDQAHAAGFKSISYSEAYGQAKTFIGELGGVNSGGYNNLLHQYWNWENYAGGERVWVGPQNFFDDEAVARPYTRTHPVFGGEPMTYPDGTVATGYTGPSDNPFNSRIFDAGCSKNILGAIQYNIEWANPTVQANGPYDGLLQFGPSWAGAIEFSKDSACPNWMSLDVATARLAASYGMDGMWVDNFGPWDSFHLIPVTAAFGDWSVARFRDYLSSHFTPAELAAMGVTDVASFDVRAALRAQCTAWGGNGDDINNTPVWRDARWLDLPLWRAYVIFKRQVGTEVLQDYYDGVKQAAREAGVSDFLVCGNDNPTVGLGWARDILDMVSCESTPGSSPDGGGRGFLLPPVGRMAPQYKVGREYAKHRLVNIWCYLNGDLQQYRGKPELTNTLFYEMLATDTLPMALPDWPTWIGTFTPDAAKAFYAFVQSVKSTLGERRPVEDVGVYYSTSSILAWLTPGGYAQWQVQPHQFGFHGWATALDELHYQYRVIPEWKLNSETLAPLKVLVIPNATVFSPADVTGVLIPWVQNGGRLIVTEDSGLRLGEDGNFEINPAGLSLAPLTGVSSMTPAPAQHTTVVGSGLVLYIPSNIGLEYYNEPTERATRIADFSDAMTQVLSGAAPTVLSAPDVPSTTGLTLYRDVARRKQLVDANNTNLNPDTDVLTAQPSVTFSVDLPQWLDVPDLRVSAVSPDAGVSASIAAHTPGRATVTAGPVVHYASLVLDYPDGDEDLLSDATEGSLGTDPARADSDHDGLSDGEELDRDGTLGAYAPGADTDPLNADTDGDGALDGEEVTWGHDPLDPEDFPTLPLPVWPALLALLLTGAIWARRPKTVGRR